MPIDPRHSVLFDPIRIGCKELRNRFYQVPHCTGFGSEKPGAQARHRAVKAEGGWAAVCTEYCSIAPESDSWPSISARLWDDDDVRNLAAMADAVHEHGALAGVELWHGGAHTAGSDSRMVSRAPSALPSEVYFAMYGAMPRAMDRADITHVQELYVAAARRARSAGFDIVYVYGGHGYLLSQFLYTWYNRRADEYGGSLENRARFWLETLERVRDCIGDECAIASRVTFGVGPGSAADDETLAFVELADSLVDLWDATTAWSDVSPDEGAARPIASFDSPPSRVYPQHAYRELISRVKAHSRKPVVGVGRFTNPDIMARAVATGELDIIGAARPSIADPFLPTKIAEGRVDEIRQCVGNNICIARQRTLHLSCTQNATAGEEYRRGWHPERFTRATNHDRDVLVVGAGVAGLECAIVLAKRGMRRVRVIEGGAEPGGYAALTARLPRLHEWARMVDWRVTQASKLEKLEVITNVSLGPADIGDYGADIVIVATGSRWATDGHADISHPPIPGAELEHVVVPERVIDDRRIGTEGHYLVYDCEGYFMGPGVAELLTERGARVTLASPLPIVSPFTDGTQEGPALRRRLAKLGIAVRTATDVIRITDTACVMRAAGEDTSEEAVDGVVLVTARVPNDAIYRELKNEPGALHRAGIEELYAVGDCVAPRIFADAIFDGHRLAREIDSPHPELALPYIRERRVLGADGLSEVPPPALVSADLATPSPA